MSMIDERKADALREREDIKEALEQTTHAASIPARVEGGHDGVRLCVYGVLVLVAAGFYYVLRLRLFEVPAPYHGVAQRVALGAALVTLTAGVAAVTNVYLVGRVADVASRYNLKRVVRFVAGLLVAFIAISVVFENWYTAVVSLGLISLILGFALQTPILSLIGWVYILVRAPYRVGDRVRIGEIKGDVIDVSYLDTTLWEFGGEYLSTDHPSGRLVKFPNAAVLSTPVINYSWPLFPYIWNEIKLQIAYQSDLGFVEKTMKRVVEDELGSEMMERVRVYRELLAQTPVDHLEVRERPAVFFRVGENTWIEAIVRYLVDPRQAGRVKTRIVPRLLEALNDEPHAVLFPRADLR